MTGYEGFIFDSQEEEDGKMTLLSGRYSGPPEAQDIEAELGKLSLDLRQHILNFVANRGDFDTHVHRLVYLLKVDANRYSFIVKYYPSPKLSLPDLERHYRKWDTADNVHLLPPESELCGALISLSSPYASSAIQRWYEGGLRADTARSYIMGAE